MTANLFSWSSGPCRNISLASAEIHVPPRPPDATLLSVVPPFCPAPAGPNALPRLQPACSLPHHWHGSMRSGAAHLHSACPAFTQCLWAIYTAFAGHLHSKMLHLHSRFQATFPLKPFTINVFRIYDPHPLFFNPGPPPPATPARRAPGSRTRLLPVGSSGLSRFGTSPARDTYLIPTSLPNFAGVIEGLLYGGSLVFLS